jgi:hypothetical protein
MLSREHVRRRKNKVLAVTADRTLTVDYSGGLVTNRGASGTVDVTLPAVAVAKGMEVTFMRVAAQTLRVSPATGERMMKADGSLAAVSKGLELATDGAAIRVESDGTNWLMSQSRGTINEEA